MPNRIQRRRTKGWRMPEGAVYVGRPSRWGSPFPVNEVQRHLAGAFSFAGVPTRWGGNTGFSVLMKMHPESPHRLAAGTVSVLLFELYVRKLWQEYPGEFEDWIAPLRGKDLACWCPLDQPCHADTLLSIANE